MVRVAFMIFLQRKLKEFKVRSRGINCVNCLKGIKLIHVLEFFYNMVIMEISSVFLACLQGNAKRWLCARQNCLCVLWMLKLIKILVLQKSRIIVLLMNYFFFYKNINFMLIFSNIWIWEEALKQPIIFILCTKLFTDVFQSLIVFQVVMQISLFFFLTFLCSIILSYSFPWQHYTDSWLYWLLIPWLYWW